MCFGYTESKDTGPEAGNLDQRHGPGARGAGLEGGGGGTGGAEPEGRGPRSGGQSRWGGALEWAGGSGTGMQAVGCHVTF